MTWRRFLNLLRGLSPQSAAVAKMSSQGTFGEDRVRVVEGKAAAQEAFVALFGGRKAKPPQGAQNRSPERGTRGRARSRAAAEEAAAPAASRSA